MVAEVEVAKFVSDDVDDYGPRLWFEAPSCISRGKTLPELEQETRRRPSSFISTPVGLTPNLGAEYLGGVAGIMALLE